MIRKRHLLLAVAAAAFYLLACWSVVQSHLLKPYYEFHRSSSLLYFTALHLFACFAYVVISGALLLQSFRRAISCAFISGATLYLLLLFFESDHVMLAELVGNRMFYFYFLGVRAVASVCFVLGGGLIIYKVIDCFLSRSTSVCFIFLPIALLSVYPFTQYLPGVLASAILVAATLEAGKRGARFNRLKGRVGASAFGVSRMLSDDRAFVTLIFSVGLLLRAAYAIRTASVEESQGFIWDDAVVYERGAQDFSFEGYSLFLRAIYTIFGHSYAAVGIIQSVLGALTCVLIFGVAKEIFDKTTGKLAASISVVYGTQLFLPAMHARETLLSFLLIASIYLTLKLYRGGGVSSDLAIGAVVGLLGLVKAIAFPVILPIALYRMRAGQGRLRNVAALMAVATAIVASKQVVNRPLNVPVGRSTSEYAALAYFAGNHPFSSEEEWFNLSREQYEQLASMGFNVSEGAGTREAMDEWKAKYPRIAYCDKVTFETNTGNLIRYNLSHPLRAAQVLANNFLAFFLGVFHHHRLFDPIYLLNNSAFSILFRIHWLLVFIAGSFYALRQYVGEPRKRKSLFLIYMTGGYFVAIYTLMIGTTIYSIPIIPLMLIVQSFGFVKLTEAALDVKAVGERSPKISAGHAPLESIAVGSRSGIARG
ncbi:MAG TPA: glycosyltransferase family 39 protein [Blastocatellia bacterium]|jgi:hypothetical protein